MSDFYTCGTCGSRTLVIESTYDINAERYVWIISCGEGHQLVPIPANIYTIDFD